MTLFLGIVGEIVKDGLLIGSGIDEIYKLLEYLGRNLRWKQHNPISFPG